MTFKNCCCCWHEEEPVKEEENGVYYEGEFIRRLKINNVAIPVFCTPEFRAEVQAKFKLRPSCDIFIVTYPKSGTTWIQKIIRELLFKDDVEEWSNMMLSDRIPYVDMPLQMKLDIVEAMPSPRVFKCHNNSLEELDNLLLKGDKSSKFIYMMRDPRDVSVSLYHHLRTTGVSNFMNTASFDEFHKRYMRNGDEVFYGLWEKHVDNWLSKHKELNMLVLRYEKMKTNPYKSIERIAKFLGLDPTKEQVEDVAKKTTIEYMMKEANVIADKSGKTSSVLRKGIVGDWKNHFVDQAEAEKLAIIAEDLYKKYGFLVDLEQSQPEEKSAISQSKPSKKWDFTEELIPHSKINGVAVPFFVTPEFRDNVREKFKLRPASDIFIVTYPKSGTTWTQKIVRELLFKDEVKEWSDMMLSDRIPWVDSPFEMKLDFVEALPSPRAFKCHNHSLEELDDLLLKGDRTSKFIYVLRDPRDVSVSLWCHMRTMGLTDFMSNAPFHDFHEQFTRNADWVMYGLWETHVENWLSKRKELNMLVLRYENMKVNPRKNIEQIAKFLGLNPTEKLIEGVAKKTTIEYMKKEANVIADKSGQTSSILRKGIVGDWKNHFVDKQEAEKLGTLAEKLYDKYGLSEDNSKVLYLN